MVNRLNLKTKSIVCLLLYANFLLLTSCYNYRWSQPTVIETRPDKNKIAGYNYSVAKTSAISPGKPILTLKISKSPVY